MIINELFYILSISGLGVCIYNCYTSCPTVADDMILMAFRREALQIMINICYNYSCKCRFEYNSSKCAVIVFNSGQINKNGHVRNEVILETTSIRILFFYAMSLCHRALSSTKSAKRLRETFGSIISCGFTPGEINPNPLRNIYFSVVLLEALYGAFDQTTREHKCVVLK